MTKATRGCRPDAAGEFLLAFCQQAILLTFLFAQLPAKLDRAVPAHFCNGLCLALAITGMVTHHALVLSPGHLAHAQIEWLRNPDPMWGFVVFPAISPLRAAI